MWAEARLTTFNKIPRSGVLTFDATFPRRDRLFPMVRTYSKNAGDPWRRLSRARAAAALIIALSAVTAGLFSDLRQSRAAAGSEAWCIVTDEGDNKCNYASSQECLQAVANGNRGFCNVNSSAAPASGAPAAERRKRH
jgi:hypothetical protein